MIKNSVTNPVKPALMVDIIFMFYHGGQILNFYTTKIVFEIEEVLKDPSDIMRKRIKKNKINIIYSKKDSYNRKQGDKSICNYEIGNEKLVFLSTSPLFRKNFIDDCQYDCIISNNNIATCTNASRLYDPTIIEQFRLTDFREYVKNMNNNTTAPTLIE